MFEQSPLRDRLELEGPEEIIRQQFPEDETTVEDNEKARISELLDFVWDEYKFVESITELEEVLGSRQVIDGNYLLAQSKDSYYRSTDPYYCIPGVTRIGARHEDISFARPIKGTNIVGLKGQVLFYRTQIENGRYVSVPTKHNKSRTELETYHEAGFFCFVIAEQDPETGSVRPSLVFGDMDKAKWPTQAAKIRAIQLLSGRDFQFGHHRSDEVKYRKEEIEDFEEILLTPRRKRTLKADIKPGVLTQNNMPLVGDESDKYFTNEKLRTSMQEFIDKYSKPEQIRSDENYYLQSSELNLPDSSGYHPISLRHHGLSWEHMHKVEITSLPLFRSVSKTRVEQELRGTDALYYYSVCRAIGIILKDIPRERIFSELQRTDLTDEEVKLIHSLETVILSAIHMKMDGNEERRFVNSRWKYFLESRPDLYPGITTDRLLKEPELVASLQYQKTEVI